jgi:hypothetical protein
MRRFSEVVPLSPLDLGMLDGVEDWLRTRRVAAGEVSTRVKREKRR